MAQSSPMKKTLRQVNAFFSKIGWLYLMIISLLILVFIQWYTSSTRPNSATQRAQAGQLQQLESQINQQSQLIESLQKEITNLKQGN